MNLTLPGRNTVILSIYLILTGILVAGMVFLWGSYNGILTEYTERNEERARKESQYKNIEALRIRFEELQTRELHFKPYFPRNKQEQVVLETLTNLAAASGLSLDSITPRGASAGFREAGGPSIPEFPVDMQVQGTLAQISSLLRGIEAEYPMIRCTRLSSASIGIGKTALTLDTGTDTTSFQLTFNTYYKQNP